MAHAVAPKFANSETLSEHWHKHVRRQGEWSHNAFQTPTEYERYAQTIWRLANEGADGYEIRTQGTNTVYFSPDKEFVSVSAANVIRTLFIPTDGKYYYDHVTGMSTDDIFWEFMNDPEGYM